MDLHLVVVRPGLPLRNAGHCRGWYVAFHESIGENANLDRLGPYAPLQGEPRIRLDRPNSWPYRRPIPLIHRIPCLQLEGLREQMVPPVYRTRRHRSSRARQLSHFLGLGVSGRDARSGTPEARRPRPQHRQH